MEERLNETKRFDELNEDESRLKRLNEEDQAIIDDANASELGKEAAEERMAARNEELLRLKAQILKREAAMSLRERVRLIFTKYGVTVTSIFLAAGITIGAVVGAINNGIKTLGNQLANGRKTVGEKAASALPGLIGAIVSFLLKTAGQAIGYLAEHTWLLILAAVEGRMTVGWVIFDGPPSISCRPAFFVPKFSPLLTPSFIPALACLSLLL